ncbi:MAG: hypothetical protein QOJ72_799 [Nocardioidaceae bacterium]|jgi:hypothetical protein|nr:hypothetical protein [Nocardioidaceae bacterium]
MEWQRSQRGDILPPKNVTSANAPHTVGDVEPLGRDPRMYEAK